VGPNEKHPKRRLPRYTGEGQGRIQEDGGALVIKPTTNVIRAIVNLQNDTSWQEIVKWIEESYTTQSLQNNHNRGEEVIRMQGGNTELETILKHINNARQYLEYGRD
jgi:hypothetical protein